MEDDVVNNYLNNPLREKLWCYTGMGFGQYKRSK